MCCWSVGLVQYEIEAAGFTTISLSMIPELTVSAGAPRVAAVEHPFGVTVGLPGDVSGQLAVLRAALEGLTTIPKAGGVVEIPCTWPADTRLDLRPPQDPPIVSYLKRRPWEFGRFFNRTPPPECAAPADS